MCEKIITKIGEQKIMVAASPTGNLANPMNMQVTVRQPMIPKGICTICKQTANHDITYVLSTYLENTPLIYNLLVPMDSLS